MNLQASQEGSGWGKQGCEALSEGGFWSERHNLGLLARIYKPGIPREVKLSGQEGGQKQGPARLAMQRETRWGGHEGERTGAKVSSSLPQGSAGEATQEEGCGRAQCVLRDARQASHDMEPSPPPSGPRHRQVPVEPSYLSPPVRPGARPVLPPPPSPSPAPSSLRPLPLARSGPLTLPSQLTADQLPSLGLEVHPPNLSPQSGRTNLGNTEVSRSPSCLRTLPGFPLPGPHLERLGQVQGCV